MLNKKKVLGRGLSALIGDAGGAEAPRGGEKYFLCPVLDISPNRMQPRKRFNEDSLKELSDSIKEKGVIEPLIVRRNSGGFELIAGERRWRAAKMAGLKEVPTLVIEVTDEECLEYALIENIQREDLNAIEEAEAYRSLMNLGITQEEVSKRVGKERATVANYLRLLKLPYEVKEELIKDTITMGHARAILSIESHAAQTELCRRIVTMGLSVREAEKLANSARKRPPRQSIKAALPDSMLEAELRAIFGTKILVKDTSGRGRIEILYFSAEERERIIDLLRSINQR